MKLLIVLFAVVCAALADVSHLPFNNLRSPKVPVRYNNAPVQQRHTADEHSGILRNDVDIHPDGTYNYAYETANGIRAEEQGNPAGAQGSFGYTSPEGERVEINYVANEDGFQPQGSHIPVAPPVPELILRALEWIRTHPEQEARDTKRRF